MPNRVNYIDLITALTQAILATPETASTPTPTEWERIRAIAARITEPV